MYVLHFLFRRTHGNIARIAEGIAAMYASEALIPPHARQVLPIKQ
jgi:hypothetical protein